MMTLNNEMINHITHICDVIDYKNGIGIDNEDDAVATHDVSKRFNVDNWQDLSIEHYPEICAYLGVEPFFEDKDKKITDLEAEVHQLREERDYFKRIAMSCEDKYWQNIGDDVINVEDLKRSLDNGINKIFDGIDILTQIEGKSISIPDHVVSVK